ncbi:MAG: N-acetyltransferase, partial [Gammaproteobacteria bacterium]
PELSAWMDWAVKPQTPEETAEFVRGSETSWAEETALNLLMVETATGEIVGATGYPRLDWKVPKFEIGYWVRSDRVGQGYASESTWALARHAFEALGANRVELKMDDRNRKSWAVAERLGFALEGTLRNDVRVPDDSLRDTRIYGAVRLGDLQAPG